MRVQAELTQRNIGIVAIREGINTSDFSAAARFFQHSMLAQGAYQLESASERVRDGMKADVMGFDPDTIRANATFEEPKQYPDGISQVIVNGAPVVGNGSHTGARPGRALRSE